MGSVGNPRPSLGNLPLLLLPLLCSCFTEHVQTKQLHDAAKGGPWDAHAALAAHKRHRRTVQAKESSAGSKLASLLGKTQDLFVDRHYRDAATGWLEAQKHCQAEGRRLCRIDEYCGAATHPVRETVHGDHWAPVADERGQYIAIGDMFPDRVCRTHSHCCGGLPSWGMEGMAGLLSLCCGKADKLAQKAFLGTIERRAHKMLTSEITHDEARVLKRLRYWLPQAGAKHGHKRLTANELQAAFPTAEGKYLSFEVDGGGFNNIRIAFEFMVMLSVITGRTLVLPPARGWYLIDWGGMGKKLAADQKKGGHLREFVDTGHLSTFADFFDTKDMCGVTRCVTAEEFVQREGAALGVPQRFRGPEGAAHLKGGKNGDPFPWEDWLRLHSRWGSFNPLAQVLYWPSKPAVASAGREPDSTLRDGRQAVGMPKEESEAKLLHFPHCTAYNKGGATPKWLPKGHQDYRYLGQIAALGAFSTAAQADIFKRFLKDRVHYHPRITAVAAKIVAHLGLFGYASMHVRRNELQYKEVFIEGDALARNIEPLLLAKEPMYLATDEVGHGAFSDIEANGHTVFRWEDFAAGGKHEKVLKSEGRISTKFVGQIEQVICSGARLFIATPSSTFSGFIPRLRGYMEVPDKTVYYNTHAYWGPIEEHPKVKGTDFYREYPALW